ncbi:histone-lysine N-methyltransferase EHMT1a isoform X2 [Gadus macrocephalus]|nr:histone-lysine N-methyltransferase EHMT1a isoform X2 [Gadus macrocephalus]
MDRGAVSDGSAATGRRSSEPTSKGKGMKDHRSQLPSKISPFHNSFTGSNDGLSGRKAAASTARTQGPQSLYFRSLARSSSQAENQTRDKLSAHPSSVKQNQKAIDQTSSSKTQSVKRKKRKMGMYNLVPKKKTRVLKQPEKKDEDEEEEEEEEEEDEASTTDTSLVPDTESVEGDPASTLTPGPPSPLGQEGDAEQPRSIEYTELALDSLDLKAQEELLSPPLTVDADLGGGDLAEEHPLCCCRIETPSSKEGTSAGEQTCMAIESSDGMMSRCQRRVLKQEMMRPSSKVHLMVLCEDHRGGMVKHQCCPGCGLFCRAGSFQECRPYGSISHRFHHGCATVLKGRLFCPHCGENPGTTHEVTVSTATASAPPNPHGTPVPRVVEPCPPLLPAASPAAAAVAIATTTRSPALRAKKTSEPWRTRGRAPDGNGGEAGLGGGGGARKDPLEGIRPALDDESLKHQKVKLASRMLYISAKEGDLQKVIHLLVDGKDPNLPLEEDHMRTPLHAAAAEGHQEVCHMLLQARANLEMFDDKLKTPLMCAAENNRVEAVKYLLSAGSAVCNKDIQGSTCLHLAAKLGHDDVVQLLLTKAAKYINCQDIGGWTPITWAIEHKHHSLVHLLVTKGADVNIRDKEENVCLHWAALSGCEDVAQNLLDARSYLHAANIHGDTPLHIAARQNHLECVMLFLARSGDVTLRNRDGETALDCCAYGSKVWSALATNKKLTDARRQSDGRRETLLSRDISRGYEALAISCVNEVDAEPCPSDYKYVSDSCVTSPLHADTDITHLQHCSCPEDCGSGTCMCGQLSLCCWYDNEGRLPLDASQREPPVLFECNQACSCWRTCRNRVVQNGLRVRLQLYRTQKMGWGVQALQDIPQGAFICEYVGEIVTDAEADKRENDSFLFTLDNKVGEVHCIDARRYGNVGRFVNHLCDPNLVAVRVFTSHQDLRFPRIAFFSCRPIRAGEQIGFDYGDHYWRIKRRFFSCQCGSMQCRHSSSSSSSSSAATQRGRGSDATTHRLFGDGNQMEN